MPEELVKERVDKLIEETKKLYELLKLLEASGPRSDTIDMTTVVHEKTARMLVDFTISHMLPSVEPRDVFLNGLVLGVFLSELGRASFLTREQQGSVMDEQAKAVREC